MKRFLPLFMIALAFSSCQEDVKFNNPGFQGLKDDVFWRAIDARAYVSTSGALKIEALTQYETVTLNTASANVGKYALGSSNLNNSATYSSNFNDDILEYGTTVIPGPVSNMSIYYGGTAYVTASNVATTGGSGSGLTVNITANASGIVTAATVSSPGNAYLAGDIVNVAGGTVSCKLKITNVQNSNGEIEITEYDNLNMTVTGKFKFNAVNTNNNPSAMPVLNFQYGEFYKVPIYPSN